MNAFKKIFAKNKQQPEYIFSRTIPYNGYEIFVYCQKDETQHFGLLAVAFITGWNVSGYGFYNTGIDGKGLDDNILNHVKDAKNYIDKLVEAPVVIERAKEMLSKLEIQ